MSIEPPSSGNDRPVTLSKPAPSVPPASADASPELGLPADDNRFESEPQEALDDTDLPAGWTVARATEDDVEDLTALLRRHETRGRGWASSSEDDVLVAVSGVRTRENLLIRDADGVARGWVSAHDRAAGRMLTTFAVDRELPADDADRCARVLLAWCDAQACAVGESRGVATQQIDATAFADDHRHQQWLAEAGYRRVRSWWQMVRPVVPEDAELAPTPGDRGVVVRRVRREGGHESGTMPDATDLHTVHDVLEAAFADHFNSHEESFDEFVHRLREDPGHRWDHWWLAEIVDGEGGADAPEPAGALVGTWLTGADDTPDGSFVAYIGVLENARGRGVAKALLRTIIADAAERGRNRVGLEVDADSPTGAHELYVNLGWETKYVTESWHKDVPVRP